MGKGKFDTDEVLQSLQAANEKSSANNELPVSNSVAPSGNKSVIANQRNSARAMNNRRKAQQYMHDPSRIRMWAGHNRDYSALDADSCSDLIEAFGRGAQGQRFAAIVRKVKGSDDYDFEVICGARRHWTASYRQMELLIEVRDLTDKEAFTLQDLENRDRKDVSDLERAIDYKNALKSHFDNNLSAISNYLQYDKSNFLKLLFLAELPEQIIAAYGDKRDLKVHHGSVYRKMLEKPETKRLLLRRAGELKDKNLPGKEVFAQLKKPASAPVKENKVKVGSVTLTKKTPKLLQLNLDVKKNMSEDELKKIENDCSRLIRSLFKTAEAVEA